MPKNKLNKDSLCKLCAHTSFLLLLVALASQVIITNKFAIKGAEMGTLQGNHSNLEREVSLLKLSLAEVSSLSSIEDAATELGFIEFADQVAVISSAQFAALSDY